MERRKVKKIKEFLSKGNLTQSEIGAKFGVGRSVVSDIATGRRYADVPGPSIAPRQAGGQSRNPSVEQRNILLEGMVSTLRDEKNLLTRQLRAASKREYIVDSIAQGLTSHIKPLAPPKGLKIQERPKGAIQETVGLILSDTHCDQWILPQEVDGLEHYTFPIASRRGEVLVHDALQFLRGSLTHKFRKLVVFGLGDYVSGEIHGQVAKSYFGDAYINDLATAQLFSLMFRELSEYFEEIIVYNITGNHGRLTEKCEFGRQAANANHDTLIMKIVEIHCKELKNIKFHFPEGMSTIVDVDGHKFHLTHGHTKRGSSAAWNRAKKLSEKVVPLHGGEVKYFLQGHYHTPGDVVVSGGATLLANGAWPRCDSYSYQTLGESSEPSQLLFGIHKNRGVTWRFPIELATADEHKGPQRYKIDLLGGRE